MARRPWLFGGMQLWQLQLMRLVSQRLLAQLQEQQREWRVLELEAQKLQVGQPWGRVRNLNLKLDAMEQLLAVRSGRWATLTKLNALLTFITGSGGEEWAASLGWFIPRKYRDAVLGDIMEDCVEMRGKGCSEKRIKFHVLHQWAFAVVMLVPTAISAWIADLVKQVVGR